MNRQIYSDTLCGKAFPCINIIEYYYLPSQITKTYQTRSSVGLCAMRLWNNSVASALKRWEGHVTDLDGNLSSQKRQNRVTLLDGWIINAIYSLEKTHFAWDKKHFLWALIYSFTHYDFHKLVLISFHWHNAWIYSKEKKCIFSLHFSCGFVYSFCYKPCLFLFFGYLLMVEKIHTLPMSSN